ncbi:MAG: 50S ribosomal protein L29 [Candidatus Omnitrophota bacterium]|nr:50S ribosomal protein L29 [Candidatus Omnitrophota bacterium]MDZ4242916.1 50S ribosomal protein L29 [Candidatus Omnitrophota bacterium]
MKMKELEALSSEELLQKERAFKKSIFELDYQKKMGRVEKPAQYKLLRRDIARILTLLNQRKTQKT